MLASLAALLLGCSLAPRQGMELTDVFLTDDPSRVHVQARPACDASHKCHQCCGLEHISSRILKKCRRRRSILLFPLLAHVQVDDFGSERSDDKVLRRVTAELDLGTGAISVERRASRVAVRTVAEQLGEPSDQAKYRLMLVRPKEDEASGAGDSMAIVTAMADTKSVPRMLSRTMLDGGAAADAKPASWRDETHSWFASETLNQIFVLYTSASGSEKPQTQLAIGRLNARGRMDEAVYAKVSSSAGRCHLGPLLLKTSLTPRLARAPRVPVASVACCLGRLLPRP